MNEANDQRIIRAGRLLFAAGIIALGLQHYYNADFIPVVVPSLPQWIHGRYFWTCVAGMGLIMTGAAIMSGKAARPAAVLLGSVLLALVVLRHVPDQAAANPGSLGAWTAALKALALAGGAFAVAATRRGEASPRTDRLFTAFGCCSLGLMCVVFGTDHFLYAQFVASLVPAWIPGHVFWTYFCGAALIAAGLAMILGIRARLASGLLGSMLFAWLIMLHIPRALAQDYGADMGNEWTSVFEAAAFSGVAFILSRTLPRKAL